MPGATHRSGKCLRPLTMGEYCRPLLQKGSNGGTGHHGQTQRSHGGERYTGTLRGAGAAGAAGLGGRGGGLGGGGRLGLSGGGLGLHRREGRSRSAGADDSARSTGGEGALGGDDRLGGHSSGLRGSLASCQHYCCFVDTGENACLPRQQRTEQRRERRKPPGR
ncbi:uncharacterized protein BO66DRAFT_189843 [Aspergillus aculeatinus CBS 121060]|uniref:Uncharacterized protein n=1 Tax=Aspergillus aculeatinus CBS 121060 TaxID=1448322 RepID=A0ACD1GY55_9EURO|nr:hypothetical protein BO66DRAFT_189843 [Aspergillus aculeatinus CBS 121060]RAH66193.1 hypothetical protein BO66DRAFT_189843 [Aspergillus aculeatinus CBS 121060]